MKSISRNAASRDEISDNNAENYDDWYSVTDEQLDSTCHILEEITCKILDNRATDEVKPDKKSVKVPMYIGKLAKNINVKYDRKTNYKTTTALMYLGGIAFDDIMGIDAKELHDKVVSYSDADLDSFLVDDGNIIKEINRESKYSMPAKVFEKAYARKMKRNEEDDVLTYINVGFIQNKFAYFGMLGFDYRQTAALLILLGVNQLPHYAAKIKGFADLIEDAVNPTIEQLKKLDIDI